MKKLVLFLLILMSFKGTSQLKKLDNPQYRSETIGSIVTPSIYLFRLNYENGQKAYLFSFRDRMAHGILPDPIQFQFYEQGNDLEEMYKIIMDGFRKMPVRNIRLDVPNYIIELEYLKVLQPTVSFVRINKAKGKKKRSGWLTQKQINKLFGKS